MKRRIYLVRHAESASNAGGPLAGEKTPLTERGFDQARFMAARAAKLPLDAIISSSMLRARQTAECIAEATNKPIVATSDLFVERRHPSGQLGLTEKHPETIRLEQFMNNNFGQENFRHSDEENFYDLRTRAQAALAYLTKLPYQNILVVTHGTFLNVLSLEIKFGDKLTSKKFEFYSRILKPKNVDVSIYEYTKNGWRPLKKTSIRRLLVSFLIS